MPEQPQHREKNNTNWLARIFQYIYDVIVAADRPIFMAAMVVLPFIAPLLPAMITGTNLQQYLFPEHPNWVWIGITAFELVAMLAQVASVSARMNLKEDPKNPVLVAEASRADWSYAIYIITLIAANVFLELANGVKVVNVFVVACLTVGLSFSSSLINASRIHKRDIEDKKLETENREQARSDQLRKEEIERQDKIRKDREAMKMERWRLKHGYGSTYASDTVSTEFQNSFGTKEKQGRPSEWETPVFNFMDECYRNSQQAATFSEVLENVKIGEQSISKAQASKLRNRWLGEKRWEKVKLDQESN